MAFDRNAEADQAYGHKPVLLDECLEALAIRPDGVYLDGTLGRAGHSLEILRRLTAGGRLIGLDRDGTALEAARVRLAEYADRVTLVHSNFSRLAEVLDDLHIYAVDGMLFDLGVSSPQLDDAERGFSYMHDAPLDMRMDRTAGLTARDVVNGWSYEELRRILFEYGEERYAPAIARAIVRARETAPVKTTLELVEELRRRVKEEHIKTVEEARACMCRCIADAMTVGDAGLDLSTRPSVVLFIGVNGVGKTTTIGKIGSQLRAERKKVLFCAADTFRAAAAEQLTIWAERAGVDIVKQHEGADPAAVVFDATSAAKARRSDVVLVDTAGRLHNKQNLMNELNKISRIVERELPNASREVLLVLDGTTGQNGLIQAKQFKEIAGVTALAVTKLDGTAKGGIVIAVADTLGLPVKFIGVGEKAEDLMRFQAKDFVDALFE